MNKVYAIGIALLAALVCSVGIEIATAQGSLSELNNFVDPVTLKVQEMKTSGMNETEIVEALKTLGMGYYPETGATWIGRTPSPEELQNLPPRRYPFTNFLSSQLTTASEAKEQCQLMGTKNANYNGFSNYMKPGSLSVGEEESHWHVATTHIGKAINETTPCWTEVGVIRGLPKPSPCRIFSYDNDEGGYVFHGTTNQSAYTQYQILVSNIHEPNGWKYNIFVNGSWIRSGHLAFYENGVDKANEVWSYTGVWTRDTEPTVFKDPLLFVNNSTIWWNESVPTERFWMFYYITNPVRELRYLSGSAWRYETWVNQFPVHNLNTRENFSTIHAAIDDNDTKNGHTITVDSGTYYGGKADSIGRGVENVDVYKQLTIKSTSGNPADTIIQAANSSDHVFNVIADHVNISGFTVKGANETNNAGIYLYHANYCNISNNNISNNNNGVSLDSSNNNIITSNNISNNNDGIYLDLSRNNILTNNNANLNKGDGILLHSSNNNILENSNASNNNNGICLDSSSNNTLRSNNANSNNWRGIHLWYSSNNKIYLNNFMNNSLDNVYSYESNNIWNSTKKIAYTYNINTYTNYLGNYWDDYKGNDTNKDGIGDTSYSIDSEADNYPLMEPYENYFKLPEGKILDTGVPANPYPSIFGNHTGTIKSNHTVIATKLYTYPCPGTGGHTEYARIWNSTWNATVTWDGYVSDWHNITFDRTVILMANETYNYTIRTGSYPQVHHTDRLETEDGVITCGNFVDAKGKVYNDWIPAIRLE